MASHTLSDLMPAMAFTSKMENFSRQTPQDLSSGAKDKASGRAVRVEFSILVYDSAFGRSRPAA